MPPIPTRPTTITWTVLLLCAAATGWAWQTARSDELSDLQSVFGHEAVRVADGARNRIEIYSDMLHGARGLFAASKSVERHEWHAYAASLRIAERFPGIRAMGFLAAVPRQNLDAFLNETRADGAPDFAIQGESEGDVLYVLKYEEVFEHIPSPLGFNIASEPNRRAAAEQARDTGKLAATAPITLIADQSKGFVLFLPVYRVGMPTATVNERRAAIEGFVCGVFRATDFMQEVTSGQEPSLVFFEVFDGPIIDCGHQLHGSWTCGYSDAGSGGAPAALEKSFSVPIGGRIWTILVRPTVGFLHSRSPVKSLWVLLSGSLISLLLIAAVWSLVNTQTRAVTIAETMTKELREAQMQLTRAAKLESTGRLAAGVAHEVKNPLAIVVMGLDYLETHLEHHTNPQVIQVLRDMRAAIHRADFIVKGLLNFSSQRELVLKPHNLNEIVEQSLVLVKHEFQRAHIQVEARLSPQVPQLNLDWTRLEQVFINLFMNAIQAMNREGQLIVTTGLRTESGQEPSVFVSVEDTGSGIPEKLIGKIFDPFFTTKPTGQGTGLGLTVTQKIIELHGGNIMVANRPEGGAIITILFGAPKAR